MTKDNKEIPEGAKQITDPVEILKLTAKGVTEYAIQTSRLRFLFEQTVKPKSTQNYPEIISNITLALRHLEDAEIRLQRAMMAVDPSIFIPKADAAKDSAAVPKKEEESIIISPKK